jgi:hypothetical protein
MRSGSKPADKPVGIFSTIRTAHGAKWRSPQFYVLTVGAMQLLVILIAMPMIWLLYRLVVAETGLDSIACDRISHVPRNPLADVTLLVIAIVAVVTIMTSLVPCSKSVASSDSPASSAERPPPRLPQGLLMIV